MGVFSEEELFGMTIRESANDGSDFTSPAADYRRLFLGEDGQLHTKNSAGAVAYVGGGYELDYAEITSDASITATTSATANTVVTGSAITYDGATIILVEFFTPFVTPPSGALHNVNIDLYDGSSSIGIMALVTSNPTNASRIPVYCAKRLTPSAAAHTYSIRSFVDSGTGTIRAGAGGAGTIYPSFMRIIKV